MSAGLYGGRNGSKFCEGKRLRKPGCRHTGPPVCCILVPSLQPKLSVILVFCFVLSQERKKKKCVALPSVPETLTCDVYRLNPRVRLLGAASRAFASLKELFVF